jgi:hypothetical protein
MYSFPFIPPLGVFVGGASTGLPVDVLLIFSPSANTDLRFSGVRLELSVSSIELWLVAIVSQDGPGQRD